MAYLLGDKNYSITKSPKTEFTAKAQVVRKIPFMLREPQHERDKVVGNSSTLPFVLSGSKGEWLFFRTTCASAVSRLLLRHNYTAAMQGSSGRENAFS
jgi:hypothetical protein